MEVLEGLADIRAGGGEDGLDDGVPVAGEGAFIEGVEGEAFPAIAGGGDLVEVSEGHAVAEDLPFSGRGVPGELAVGGELVG